MKNATYLERTWGEMKEQDRVAALKAMKNYGDNHWWESDDQKVIAYYQLFEPILIVRWNVFHDAVEKLLGHSVYTHEFAVSLPRLQEEAQKAFNAS